MSGGYRTGPYPWPLFGCLGMALALFFVCLMPFLLVDTMRVALERLHLSPQVAALAVAGIFLGGLVNIPVYRIPRQGEQVIELVGAYSVGGWGRTFHRVRPDTIVAVNLGGCVIPVIIAAWELKHLLQMGGWGVVALGIAAVVNIGVCYRSSFPLRGVGIAMPGLISPLVSIVMTWLLLGNAQYDPIRAPVAFIAGVVGPVVGADLMHLKDITKVSAGVLSIGGAGTFNGIVLSGVLAALLA